MDAHENDARVGTSLCSSWVPTGVIFCRFGGPWVCWMGALQLSGPSGSISEEQDSIPILEEQNWALMMLIARLGTAR